MKGKNLIILGIAAVVLVGLAVVSQKKSARRGASTRTGEPIFAELPVNDVTRIVVTSPDGSATVSRVDGTWVSEDTYNYPVDFAKVRGALITLSELEIGQELKTLSDVQRQSLKMLPPGVSDENGGTLVELYGAGRKPIASLLLGVERERQTEGAPPLPMGAAYPDGRYVSPDGGKSVFLVAETLTDIQSDADNWLDKEIVNVTAQDVTALDVAAPGADPLHFARSGSDLVLEGLAENEEMDSAKAWTLKSGLSYLRFEDVAPPELTDAASGLSNAVAYTVTTADGTIYNARIGASPADREGRYFCIGAELAPEEAVDDEDGSDAEDDASTDGADGGETAAEEAAAKRAEQQDQVDACNERVAQWTFVIPQHKADSLLLERDDVVKTKAEEDDDDAAAEDAEPASPEPVDGDGDE